MASSSSSDAQKTWDMANNVQVVDLDSIYKYNAAEQKEINNRHPWRGDPHWFKKVKVSATALIKMVMHARSGGAYEVMGLMQGKLDGDTFVVLDSFPLPVQGTETRVNAGSEGNEFAVMYQEGSKAVGRPENVVGWYHSHPGYGCWLSGIDVSTQMTNQLYQDPFLSIVIDPNRTVSAGRVEIGAFRTYPEGYTPPNAAADSEYQSIPLSKIEDFGVHASRYYSLEVTHFKSSLDTKLLDLLWNKYWAMTLSQSPLLSNRAFVTSQISDLTNKLHRAETAVTNRAPISYLAPDVAAAKSSAKGKEKEKASSQKEDDTPLSKVIKDSNAIDADCRCGLFAQQIKSAVFNHRATHAQVDPTLQPVPT